MIKDVGDLLRRHIGCSGHISGSAELHGGIREDPFEAIVGKDCHMIAGGDAQIDQCGRKRERPLDPSAVGVGMKSPVRTTGREGGEIPPPFPRFPEEGSEVR